MGNAQTYKNEHSVCQIPPLDLPDVVLHRGHFVVVFPYRLFLPKVLWKNINPSCYSIHGAAHRALASQLFELSPRLCRIRMSREDGEMKH